MDVDTVVMSDAYFTWNTFISCFLKSFSNLLSGAGAMAPWFRARWFRAFTALPKKPGLVSCTHDGHGLTI